ncbi:MAG: hypothetical protein AB1697_04770 [Pseudomonadota bacterium]
MRPKPGSEQPGSTEAKPSTSHQGEPLIPILQNTQLRQRIHHIAGWILGSLSLWLGYQGVSLYIATSGFVSSSEFGMLITLVNQIASLMLWLMAFGLWQITRPLAAQPSAADAP